MKTMFRIVGLLALIFMSQTAISQGLEFGDSTDYEDTPRKELFSVLNVKALPSKVDLSMYVPDVLNQGGSSTCVGMSAGYYMRTMLEAIQLGITDKKQINKIRYSPSYLYNAIKGEEVVDCENGTVITRAFEQLKNSGIARYEQQGFPSCTFDSTLNPEDGSKIMDYATLFNLTQRNKDKIDITKKALSESGPVVVGIQTTPSIDELSFWRSIWLRILQFFKADDEKDYLYSLWQPEKSKTLRGGHAVCLTGYDDNKFGGAFQVVNSLGTSYGDKGYFWIRYNDFLKHAKYGYQAFLRPISDGIEPELAGEFKFDFSVPLEEDGPKFFRNDSLHAASQDPADKNVTYFFDEQKSGQKYRLQVLISKQAYVYVLTDNTAENYAMKRYPEGFEDAPPIGENTIFQLPNDETYLQLVPPLAKEYVLVLFSPTQISNIYSLTRSMNNMKGSFPDKVHATFGDLLVPLNQISFASNKMGFELKGNHDGIVVPLIIAFNHVKNDFFF